MKNRNWYHITLILIITLALFAPGCEDMDDDDSCEPVPGTCHGYYTSGEMHIDVTIDNENPQVTIYIYEGDIDPTDLPSPYTTTVASSSSKSINLPIGSYTGVVYYQYQGKTFMAIDGDGISNDSTTYCGDVVCYDLEEGHLDLKLDKDTIDDYFDGEDARCFIATATYGSPLAREVQELRSFRDHYLLTNRVGRFLVSTYYKYSPPLAQKIKKSPFLRHISRILLTPIVYLVKFPFLNTGILLGLLFMVYRMFRKHDRKDNA